MTSLFPPASKVACLHAQVFTLSSFNESSNTGRHLCLSKIMLCYSNSNNTIPSHGSSQWMGRPACMRHDRSIIISLSDVPDSPNHSGRWDERWPKSDPVLGSLTTKLQWLLASSPSALSHLFLFRSMTAHSSQSDHHKVHKQKKDSPLTVLWRPWTSRQIQLLGWKKTIAIWTQFVSHDTLRDWAIRTIVWFHLITTLEQKDEVCDPEFFSFLTDFVFLHQNRSPLAPGRCRRGGQLHDT